MKLRWIITRARVKLAKAIWPTPQTFPPLFVAADDGVEVGQLTFSDDDGTFIGRTSAPIILQRGDQWTIKLSVTVTDPRGKTLTVVGQFVPSNGVPIELYKGAA